MTQSKTAPSGWGDDSLSEFIDLARDNEYATFVRMKGEYSVLLQVDDVYAEIAQNLDNNSNLVESMLLLRAHSAYRAGCRLAMSGQLVESFPVLRTCLESALYAIHMYHTGCHQTWLRRNDDDDSLRRCKNDFRHSNVMDSLSSIDPALHGTVQLLYERTIDFGAHPNQMATTSSLRIDVLEDAKQYSQVYLDVSPVHIAHALKTCVQVGLGALCVSRHIFRHRFDILGITQSLDLLRSQL